MAVDAAGMLEDNPHLAKFLFSFVPPVLRRRRLNECRPGHRDDYSGDCHNAGAPRGEDCRRLDGVHGSGTPRRCMDCVTDARVGSAPADIRDCGIDVSVGRARFLGQQGGNRHDHAALANCGTCSAIQAFCTGCDLSRDRPSIVVTFRSFASLTGKEQERTALPST
jgi:hypothetical protein